MRRAERVVDVDLFAAREFVGEIAIVGLFFRMKAQVLEQERAARLRSLQSCPGDLADTVGCEHDLLPKRRAQILGDRLQAELRRAFLGASQMRAEHRRAALLAECSEWFRGSRRSARDR